MPGGGYRHIWAIQVCAAVFKQFTLGQGINQRVWVQNIGYHFPFKLIDWLKILVQTRLGKPGIATQEYKKIKSVLFWLDCANNLSCFWKTATLGQGGIRQFSVVQGSKIHLNQFCYRLRVPGSQRHIPTQKVLKYPPGANLQEFCFWGEGI